MTMPRFLQIHTLHSWPAALLNRDDAGLAKRMPFGGVERTRVSSQCLKRHWRVADDEFALSRIDPAIGISVRSRRVWQVEVEEPLVGEGFPRSVVGVVLKGLQNDLYGESEKAKKAAAGGTVDLARSEIVVLGRPEIFYLREVARGLVRQAGDDARAAEKATAEALKAFKKNFHALKEERKGPAGIDAAMFGRFVSGDRDARVDAAVHVAHAFTVHEQESEPDYFTAVDDLQAEEQGAGAGHLNTAELTSGLFYGYVVVDLPLLVANLEGCDRKAWQQADRGLAAKSVEHLLHLIAKVTPGAKLGSTAPYSYASLVLVEAGDAQPRTLANAFLDPVRGRSLEARAGAALAAHAKALDAMYGTDGRRWLATRIEGSAVEGAATVSFPELVRRVGAAVRGAD
jgi:CRISPR system Cascade subunit CasC